MGWAAVEGFPCPCTKQGPAAWLAGTVKPLAVRAGSCTHPHTDSAVRGAVNRMDPKESARCAAACQMARGHRSKHKSWLPGLWGEWLLRGCPLRAEKASCTTATRRERWGLHRSRAGKDSLPEAFTQGCCRGCVTCSVGPSCRASCRVGTEGAAGVGSRAGQV